MTELLPIKSIDNVHVVRDGKETVILEEPHFNTIIDRGNELPINQNLNTSSYGVVKFIIQCRRELREYKKIIPRIFSKDETVVDYKYVYIFETIRELWSRITLYLKSHNARPISFESIQGPIVLEGYREFGYKSKSLDNVIGYRIFIEVSHKLDKK